MKYSFDSFFENTADKSIRSAKDAQQRTSQNTQNYMHSK